MKKYRHKVIVHWGDTDPARIVFYPNYFSWFDQSTRMYFESVGLEWTEFMYKYGIIGLPIVEARSKFMRPSLFRDEIIVESVIAKWHSKMFEVGHTVYNRGEICVEGSELRAWATPHPEDPKRFRAGIIPREVIEAFD